MQGVAGTQAQGVKLSAIILAGPTVLSAVRACPPHDGVRRRWWINVASQLGLGDEARQAKWAPKGHSRRRAQARGHSAPQGSYFVAPPRSSLLFQCAYTIVRSMTRRSSGR